MLYKYTSEEFNKFLSELFKVFNNILENKDSSKYHSLIKELKEILTNEVFLQSLDKFDLEFGYFVEKINNSQTDLGVSIIEFQYYQIFPLYEKFISMYNEKFKGHNPIEVLEFFLLLFIVDIYDVKLYYQDNMSDTVFFQLIKYKELISNDLQQILLHMLDYVLKSHINIIGDKVKELRECENEINNKLRKINMIFNDIQKIEKSLEKQRQEFNFIGLSKAFQKMKDDKKKELNNETSWNTTLMIIIIFLLSSKIIGLLYYSAVHVLNLTIVTTISLSSIFLIAVLIYFFRISLINIKSIKSQILQLDLRLSLCQFIHNYAEDSEKMRSENMKDSLDRFESIIFSPIVANDEQIPTTFDNLDQFIKMMNVANGGKVDSR